MQQNRKKVRTSKHTQVCPLKQDDSANTNEESTKSFSVKCFVLLYLKGALAYFMTWLGLFDNVALKNKEFDTQQKMEDANAQTNAFVCFSVLFELKRALAGILLMPWFLVNHVLKNNKSDTKKDKEDAIEEANAFVCCEKYDLSLYSAIFITLAQLAQMSVGI